MARQTVARKDVSKQAWQAIRLNAQRTISPSVLRTTIQVDRFTGRTVVLCRAHESMYVGEMLIPAGKQFYLVASNLDARRFYAVTLGKLCLCSSKDERFTVQAIVQAKAYRDDLLKAQEVA